MKTFGPIIIEDGLINNGFIKKRKTVRAIIKNQHNELLMVYSKHFDDYTFPGGGLKADEDDITALQRELKEELGADDITIIKPCGIIEELRYGVKGSDNVYHQMSTYYHCEIKSLGGQNLADRELLHGIEPRWVSIETAICHNQSVINDDRHQVKGLKTVLSREHRVLEALKEDLSCANSKS
ncbi:MAG: NUDIX domain-containing protein [Acholeplasmataceae bacterium]|nr:NUDIX domain-containing protein [Acholeplasmataceae bacterium]